MLNDTVTALILGCALDPEAVDSIPDVISQFLDSYTDARTEFEDYWVAWNQQISIDIKGDQDGILSLALSRYEYTGGAHPNSELTYHNIDTRTGKSVAFDALLVPGMRDSLKALVESEFRKVREIPEGQDLGAAGFWFEDSTFALTENVSIGGEGITFFYNPYEIAPYSMGSTEVSLSYRQLQGVVDKTRYISTGE